MRAILLAGAAGLAIGAPGSAFANGMTFVAGADAQSPAQDQPAAGTQGGTQAEAEQGLGADIVVTAQRREENLQRTALAVSAISGEALNQASITQATDLTRLVPSLQIAPAASFTQIYLRGIGTFGANAFAEQGVAFNLDGVYLSRPAAPAGLFYDLERVEVLKGPQGTLYGRNASGGAVNVITAKPRLGEVGGNLTAEYGNFDAFKVSGAVNLPLGDNVALRLAGQHAQRDGYYSDGYDDEDTQAVRAQLRGQFDKVDLNLSMDYAHVGGKGGGGTIIPLLFRKHGKRLGPSDPAVIAAYLARSPTPPVPQVIAKGDGYQDNDFFGLAATVNLDLGFAQLTVVPAYRKTNLDFLNYSSSFKIDVTEDSSQSSLEVRLAGDTGPVEWLVGGYYFDEDVTADQLFDQGSNGTLIQSDLDTRSLAAFGQATVSVSDRLRLTGGLRYTTDNKKQDSYAESRPFVGFVPPGFPNFTPIILAIPTNATSDVDFNKLTWKAGVEFDAGPRSLLYASVATGFKSGALFAAQGRNYSSPENLTAYTLGSKNRFLDNRVQVNVEAFYWTYKDQHISHLGPVQVATTPAGPIFGPIFLTENAGSATIYGAEAELLFQASPNDLFSANLQYLHTRYDELDYQFYSTTGAPPVLGCPTSLTTQTGASPQARIYNVDCGGRPLVNAPRFTLNLGYEHKFDMGAHGNIRVGADSRIESSRFLSIEFLELGRQAGYMMSNARITYETASGKYAVTAFINNIEDELVFSNSLQSPAKPGTLYSQIRPPRTFGVRVSARF